MVGTTIDVLQARLIEKIIRALDELRYLVIKGEDPSIIRGI